MVSGFPNMFLLLGPNTGLGHNSVVFMAEAQARWISKAIQHMDHNGIDAVDVTPEAQRSWNDAIQARMPGTVWLEGGCSSWYLDANGLNTSLWPDFSFRFAQEMKRFDPAELRPVRVRETEVVA
jgi:hypothetical protein